jgi:porin
MSRALAMIGFVLALLLAGGAGHAEEPDPSHGPWLTGNWGGVRSRLFEQGLDFQFVFTSEIAYNPAGGLRPGIAYAGQGTFGLTFDLQRLIGLHDARFQMTYTSRTGQDLVANAGLDTLQLVQEVYGRGQTVRLTQFWFQQKYLNGLFDWKVGRTSMGEDFAAFSCDFQNLTFCGSNPGNIVGGYIYNWPISQWGTRLKVALDGFGYFQAGVYDQNEQYLGYPDKLLPVFYPGSTGVLVPAEVAWLPKFGENNLAGSYKLGGWYSNTMANDVVVDINGNSIAISGLPAVQHRGRYGAYLNFEQQLTKTATENPKGGLRMFLNAVQADTETSVLDRQIAVGMVYTGPFKSRPNDSVAFAAGSTHVNSRVAAGQALLNSVGLGPVSVQNSEYVFELYYTVVPVSGVYLRPNIQYVHAPGASTQHPDVVVLGLKSQIFF